MVGHTPKLLRVTWFAERRELSLLYPRKKRRRPGLGGNEAGHEFELLEERKGQHPHSSFFHQSRSYFYPYYSNYHSIRFCFPPTICLRNTTLLSPLRLPRSLLVCIFILFRYSVTVQQLSHLSQKDGMDLSIIA